MEEYCKKGLSQISRFQNAQRHLYLSNADVPSDGLMASSNAVFT